MFLIKSCKFLALNLTPSYALFILIINTASNDAFAQSNVAGKTLLAIGVVKATNPETQFSRVLKRRSKIMSVEHITTGEKSKAQFSMNDGGLITLEANTELNVTNYIFDEVTQKGSATLEVLSGGLRSISGLIKKTGGDYQVKTPVGSIGIRGTHFAIKIEGNDVYFGVFSGNIDITLNNNNVLSLGETEGFAFASVNESGEVNQFTQAPEALTKAPIALNTTQPNQKQSTALTGSQQEDSNEIIVQNTPDSNTSADTTSEEVIQNINGVTQLVTDNVYTESQWQGINGAPIAELLSERTGTFNYQELTQSNVSSSVGNASGLSLNLAIDFDNGTVPGGSLSFNDNQGEWFATYSGVIDIDQLELGINFASHANNRADGDISASFSNGLDELTGSFQLYELEDTNVNAQGSFELK